MGLAPAGLAVAVMASSGCKSHDAAPAAWPDAGAAACATKSDPGPAPLRRLTRFELARTLADTLGADPTVVDLLPPDERSSDGFDNNAAAYSVSTVHVQGWLELAETVAGELVAAPSRLATLAGCDPVADETCRPRFVRALGQRLFRRALADDEAASYLALAAAAGADDPAAGTSAVIASMLQAADFLYRPETGASVDTSPQAVSDDELATRLSYLLVGTAPDTTLLAAAAAGQLGTDEGLLAEADRLLATPRAAEAFTHFIEEWWELADLPSAQKDTQLFRTWSSDMPAELAGETRAFLHDLWQSEPTLGALLSSPRSFVDTRLASFYGDPAPATTGLQAVTRDPQRYAGLLTQGAFLATHAKANQTSPVLRGKFVRARLLCAPPPPPPADKVIVAPTVDPRLPTRERFSQHASDPFCAGCHKLMDPIGFAFEHFDAVGRWRDDDASQPVDARGELSGTDVDAAIDGVPALATRLLASKQVRDCVATQWFRWAFARRESSADDTCAIGQLSEALQASQGNLRSLIRATVSTATFRLHRASERAPVPGSGDQGGGS